MCGKVIGAFQEGVATLTFEHLVRWLDQLKRVSPWLPGRGWVGFGLVFPGGWCRHLAAGERR